VFVQNARLALFPGWLCRVAALGRLVSEARQSAASSSSRAPPKNEDEKTGGTNRAAEAAVDVTAATGQPASARRSGGPTGGSGQADAGSAGTRPACRASTGAAQRRPCSEPRPAARSRSKASGASLARAAIPQRRESRGHVPSGASAPRGRHNYRLSLLATFGILRIVKGSDSYR
jgi:hypothetical protein